MHVRLALKQIYEIIDGDDPVRYANKLRTLLKKMRKGLDRSDIDDEVVEFTNEYIDTWLVDEAIEEDIDSFIEETGDVYDKIVDEDDDDDDDDDDDGDDEDDEY